MGLKIKKLKYVYFLWTEVSTNFHLKDKSKIPENTTMNNGDHQYK
jgi:hypothetical protein